MALSRLQKWFPWAASPVICNGPMIGAACPALAMAVTRAGGIGFLGSTFNLNADSPQLTKLDTELAECRDSLGSDVSGAGAGGALPIGISFITGHASITSFADTALPIVKKHRPAAVWLFAPAEESTDPVAAKPHSAIIAALRQAMSGDHVHPPRVFVQVGNVTAARQAAKDGADVIVCQGIDAGGHQFRRGMGVVSLVPGVKKMLDEEFPGREVAVLAAGGIVNGQGVAAAMALGAEGVVMGTRFTVSEESIFPDHRKKLVLATSDGGTETFKSPFNDQINNNPLWGPLYDGRAIVGVIHEKFLAGASLEDCQKSLQEDYSPDEATKIISTWAGTGVGLVRKAEPAGDMVREVRDEAKETIRQMAGLV